jgi:hypothetical protein
MIKKYGLYVVLFLVILGGGSYYVYEKYQEQPPAAKELYVNVPSKLEVLPGRLRKIEVDTNAKNLLWINPDESKVDLLHLDSSKNVVFNAADPGVYKLILVGCDLKGNLVKAECVITVTGPQPPPVPPVPPIPPVPPVPPQPTTELFKDMKKAAEQDNDKDKVRDLAKLYASFSPIVDDQKYKTLGDLYDALRISGKEVLGNSLPTLRKVLKDDFSKTLPTDAELVLSSVVREQIKAKFKLVSQYASTIQ